MDANALLLQARGLKVDYCQQIGKAITVGGGTIRFFELRPRQQDHVWIEMMPEKSCLRANAEESGRCPRNTMPQVVKKLRQLAGLEDEES